MKLDDLDRHFDNNTKFSDKLNKQLKSSIPNYTYALGTIKNMNNSLGKSLKGAMPDYSASLAGVMRTSELVAQSLKSVMPNYTYALGTIKNMNNLLEKSLKGAVPDYSASLAGVMRTSELVEQSLKSVMPNYTYALGTIKNMNNSLGKSLKGAVPDYSASLAGVMRTSELVAQSLKSVMPNYTYALGTIKNMNNSLGKSLKGAVPNYSNLFEDFNAVAATLKLEDFLLSKKNIDNYFKENSIEDDKEILDIRILAEEISLGESIDENKLSDHQSHFFATFIFPFILILIQIILQNLTAQPTVVDDITYTHNENYYKTEVNNYFTFEQGLDKSFLNNNNLRFVGKSQIIVRKCANDSSSFVSKLPIGKIVMIIGKHKKWVEIFWKDEAGNCFSGWVQSWKLSRFK